MCVCVHVCVCVYSSNQMEKYIINISSFFLFKVESPSSSQVSREEFARVCEEKESIQRNNERVKAQLEGKLRRLEKKLSKYEERQGTVQVKEKGTRDRRREG